MLIQMTLQVGYSGTKGSPEYRATAHRSDVVAPREYRGRGSSERDAAEDAVGQLIRDSCAAR